MFDSIVMDGSWVARRAFEVGGPKAMIEAFVATVLNFNQRHLPRRTYVAWDKRGVKTLRHRLKEDYKAGRSKPAPGYSDTMSDLLEVLSMLGVYCCHPQEADDGYGEADDIAYTLAQNRSPGMLLLAADKDWLQILDLDDHGDLWIVRDTRERSPLIGYGSCESITGLTPKGWSTYLTIRGDNTDNIPGLSGVGDLRGSKLASAFPELVHELLEGSTDHILRSIDAIDPSLSRWAQLAVEERSLIQDCWELVRLRSVPFATCYPTFDPEGAAKWLDSFDSPRLAARVRAELLPDTSETPL